ncbi:MAG: glycosyltransferase N-terminal domain-containing protein [Nitrospinota bacterium]|nr:glycosyltransferase N-terminal domain-containing protein [Nitrospinota bacterium]HJM42785.1 glycosyltransferase N-terminal domain-containing protein [Nitrospinota bacterium]
MNPKALLREARFIGKAYAYLLVTFWKRGVFGRDPYFRRFFRSRWGFLPKGLGELARRRPTVWIEALSGGENTQVVTLVNRLREMYPDVNLVLSTNNRYSFEFSRKRKALDFVFDSPWDLRNVVRRVIRTLRPRVLFFIENMSYPVLCREAQRAGVRTVLLSGFMSHGYEAHEIIARSIPRRFHRFFDRIGVKSEADAEGYRRLGADPEKIKVVGEMKYDLEFLRLSDGERRGMRRTLGIPPDAPVFVAGSVRAGEDEVVLEAFRRVREHHPGFRLLMAPSYYSNTLKLDEVFSKAGLDYQRKTTLDAGEAPRDAVIIVDTFGELGRLYGIGTVDFVGASIVPKGRLAFGHNPIEPLVHGRPLLFGPHMNHWGEVTEVLLAADPGLCVRTGEEMAATILRLLRDADATRRVCLAAEKVVTPNAGAVEKNLAFAREALAETGIEAREEAALPEAVSG